jgi:hypothetical protein
MYSTWRKSNNTQSIRSVDIVSCFAAVVFYSSAASRQFGPLSLSSYRTAWYGTIVVIVSFWHSAMTLPNCHHVQIRREACMDVSVLVMFWLCSDHVLVVF